MKYWELDKLYLDPEMRSELLAAYQNAGIEYAEDGVSILHYAASHADAEAIQLLLDAGADVNVKNNYEETPLFALADLDDRYHEYSENEVYRCAQLLLEAGATVMSRSENDGETAITKAGRQGRFELINAAIECGAKLTRTNKKGLNVLHCACENVKYTSNNRLKEHYSKTVQALVDSGFDTSAKDDLDRTAMDIAIESNSKELAAILSGDVSADGIKAGGMTLHQAVEKHDSEAIRAIAANGADLNEVADKGQWQGMTPLALACLYLDIPSVELLLTLGADAGFVNGSDENCMAALLARRDCAGIGFAYRTEKDLCKKLLSLLFAAGMSKDASINSDGDTLLTAACRHAERNSRMDYAFVKTLLSFKCDVNKANLSGQTPLMLVCIQDGSGMNDLQVALLEADANTNAVDKNGSTALHYAAQNASANTACEMAEMLFDFDFTMIDSINNEGKTALEIATDNNNEPLVTMILNNA